MVGTIPFLILLSMILSFIKCTQVHIYEKYENVVELTPEKLDELVLKSDDLWFVHFADETAPNTKITDSFNKFSKGFDHIFKFGFVNMTHNKDIGRQFGLLGSPELLFFGDNKNQPDNFFNFSRTVETKDQYLLKQFLLWGIQKFKETAVNRSGIETKQQEDAKKKKPIPKNSWASHEYSYFEDYILQLKPDTYEKYFEDNDELAIFYYGQLVDSARAFVPVWNQVAQHYKDQNVNLAKIDGPDVRSLCEMYDIRNYPTVQYFSKGEKYFQNSEIYVGKYNDPADLIKWIDKQRQKQITVMDMKQLISQQLYNDYCLAGKNNPQGVCIIAFLPQLDESTEKNALITATQRKNYLKIVKRAAMSNRQLPFKYLWSEEKVQFKMENQFNSGKNGYPTIVAVQTKSNKSSVMQGEFTMDNIKQFVLGITSGKTPFHTFHEKPAVAKIENEWVAPEEDYVEPEPQEEDE